MNIDGNAKGNTIWESVFPVWVFLLVICSILQWNLFSDKWNGVIAILWNDLSGIVNSYFSLKRCELDKNITIVNYRRFLKRSKSAEKRKTRGCGKFFVQ